MHEFSQSAINKLKDVLEKLGLSCSRLLEEEIKTVAESTLNPAGPFAAVIHGDPCTDNTFDYADRLVLIDFESAFVESALLDATYPRMCMPSGIFAGKFPEKMLEEAEATYREELKTLIPEAANDKLYFQAYAHACIMNFLKLDLMHFSHFIAWIKIMLIGELRVSWSEVVGYGWTRFAEN